MPDLKIVAEAGACNGDIEYAIRAARQAASAGAWGFKVQMYRADKIVTTWAQRYDHLPSSHDTQHGAFSKTIDYGDWWFVKDLCDDVLGIEFFASCFDTEAVDACEEMNVNYYKVASGEITNLPLLRYVGTTGKNVILSTGASTFTEIHGALNALHLPRDNVTLLACSLEYPASAGAMGRIGQLKMAFPKYDIGYSDHTLGVWSTSVAVALGATMLEKHYTITPGEGGDHDMGVTPTELWEMGNIANRTEDLMWTPTAFGPMPEEQDARLLARRGVYYAKDLRAGERFNAGSVEYLRPVNAGVYPVDAEGMYGGHMAVAVKESDGFVPSDVKK